MSGTQPARTVRYDLQPRLLTVRSVRSVTPRMRRITLTGLDLVVLSTDAPTDHVKLFFPRQGEEQPEMPDVGTNGIVSRSGSPRPTSRDFTIRAHRPESYEVDIDFVLHGDGPAATWARQAKPGMPVGMIGPRGSRIVSPDLDWYLLAGDETALPAISRWLEEAPSYTRITAVIEVADSAEQEGLEYEANAEIQWIYRNGREAGTTSLLESAIRRLDFPDGIGFVWVAGEAGTLKPIRRYLLGEAGLDRAAVDVDGYWRRGTVNFDHHTPIED